MCGIIRGWVMRKRLSGDAGYKTNGASWWFCCIAAEACALYAFNTRLMLRSLSSLCSTCCRFALWSVAGPEREGEDVKGGGMSGPLQEVRDVMNQRHGVKERKRLNTTDNCRDSGSVTTSRIYDLFIELHYFCSKKEICEYFMDHLDIEIFED